MVAHSKKNDKRDFVKLASILLLFKNQLSEKKTCICVKLGFIVYFIALFSYGQAKWVAQKETSDRRNLKSKEELSAHCVKFSKVFTRSNELLALIRYSSYSFLFFLSIIDNARQFSTQNHWSKLTYLCWMKTVKFLRYDFNFQLNSCQYRNSKSKQKNNILDWKLIKYIF